MKKKLKYLFATVLLVALSVCFAISASADEVYKDAQTETAEENIFSKAYGEIIEYAGEILCAMTFAGSIVLAIAYKKGLLPLIKGSLLSIGNAVGKIKENTDESIEKHSQLTESFDTASKTLTELADKLGTLEMMLKDRIKGDGEAEREKQTFKLVLTSQIDMLYDIFMASALPQYQKDAVGEKIAAMKGALAENVDRD